MRLKWSRKWVVKLIKVFPADDPINPKIVVSGEGNAAIFGKGVPYFDYDKDGKRFRQVIAHDDVIALFDDDGKELEFMKRQAQTGLY